MLGFIIAIIVLVGIFYLLGIRIVGFQKKDESAKQEQSKVGEDYIIDFVYEKYKTHLSFQKLQEIGEWHSYGKGFRGCSFMSKEEIEKWMMKETGLSENDFSVIPVFNGLNYIRF